MFTYITLLFAALKKAFLYKNGSAAVLSLSLSTVISGFEKVYDFDFLGISFTFIMLAVALIMLDFVTGALASRHEEKNKEGWFKSKKVSYTIYKFLSIMLLLWLAQELHDLSVDNFERSEGGYWKAIYGGAASTVSIVRTCVFTLICGREYVSIGENIEQRFGKKYYAFTLFEKIFDVIELKFIKKIEKEC